MSLKSLKLFTKSLLTAQVSARVTKDSLFPLVAKGEDCNDCAHDCNTCSEYPRAFQKIGVETSDDLWGSVKMYSTHVIVATGETDWIRDVDQINGSLMQTLAMFSGQVRNGRMMISASNISPPQECHIPHGDGNTQPTALIILPSFIVLDHVHPEDAEAVIESFINQCPTTSEPLFHKNQNMLALTTSATSENYVASSPAFAGDVDVKLKPATLPICPSSTLKSRPYPHDYLILICSHHRRDARCGISAPILRKEFEKHLRLLNLWRDLNDERPGGASVVFINHIGGHKYAANVILYRKADGQGIWLARVAPKHVEGIVKYTLLQGKIVHPDMMRGGFNRSTGLTSW